MRDGPKKDKLYADHQASISDFVFDDGVAEVFPDMIKRSVPGYGTIIDLIGAFAARYVVPDSRCYDLGCSLGAAALAIHRNIGKHANPIVAVDNSLAMLRQAKHQLGAVEDLSAFALICADILDVRVKTASMVVLNFTLQFVKPERRLSLLSNIYQGLLPGGILVLSEKVTTSSRSAQQVFTEMHHSFKKAQGYSELEISQKRAALERVLLPESLACHKQRLKEVGFSIVEVWYQCFNFVSILAIRT